MAGSKYFHDLDTCDEWLSGDQVILYLLYALGSFCWDSLWRVPVMCRDTCCWGEAYCGQLSCSMVDFWPTFWRIWEYWRGGAHPWPVQKAKRHNFWSSLVISYSYSGTRNTNFVVFWQDSVLSIERYSYMKWCYNLCGKVIHLFFFSLITVNHSLSNRERKFLQQWCWKVWQHLSYSILATPLCGNSPPVKTT